MTIFNQSDAFFLHSIVSNATIVQWILNTSSNLHLQRSQIQASSLPLSLLFHNLIGTNVCHSVAKITKIEKTKRPIFFKNVSLALQNVSTNKTYIRVSNSEGAADESGLVSDQTTPFPGMTTSLSEDFGWE